MAQAKRKYKYKLEKDERFFQIEQKNTFPDIIKSLYIPKRLKYPLSQRKDKRPLLD